MPNSFLCRYSIPVHCDVDKKMSFYFIFYLFLVPFRFFAKSVDRWTSKENFEKKRQSPLFYCLRVWTCGQEAVFLFHLFFLPCTLQNVDKKVWTGGQVMKISDKKVSIPFILLLKSVDMWTRSCLSFSCFISTLCPLKF